MNNKRTLVAGVAIVALLTSYQSFADEIVVTETRSATGEIAAKANAEQLLKDSAAAAEKAAAAVVADTKLDLDIRLIGPTSVKIASKR